MKYILLQQFIEQLESFSTPIQNKFWKQLKFLLISPRHPSLDVKKYDENRGLWQARVDRKIRFYFLIKDSAYILLEIKKHPK